MKKRILSIVLYISLCLFIGCIPSTRLARAPDFKAWGGTVISWQPYCIKTYPVIGIFPKDDTPFSVEVTDSQGGSVPGYEISLTNTDIKFDYWMGYEEITGRTEYLITLKFQGDGEKTYSVMIDPTSNVFQEETISFKTSSSNLPGYVVLETDHPPANFDIFRTRVENQLVDEKSMILTTPVAYSLRCEIQISYDELIKIYAASFIPDLTLFSYLNAPNEPLSIYEILGRLKFSPPISGELVPPSGGFVPLHNWMNCTLIEDCYLMR